MIFPGKSYINLYIKSYVTHRHTMSNDFKYLGPIFIINYYLFFIYIGG
jgi:hypothetical protein